MIVVRKCTEWGHKPGGYCNSKNWKSSELHNGRHEYIELSEQLGFPALSKFAFLCVKRNDCTYSITTEIVHWEGVSLLENCWILSTAFVPTIRASVVSTFFTSYHYGIHQVSSYQIGCHKPHLLKTSSSIRGRSQEVRRKFFWDTITQARLGATRESNRFANLTLFSMVFPEFSIRELDSISTSWEMRMWIDSFENLLNRESRPLLILAKQVECDAIIIKYVKINIIASEGLRGRREGFTPNAVLANRWMDIQAYWVSIATVHCTRKIFSIPRQVFISHL